jgi:serine/threonine-protein kinase HipA
MSRELDVWLYGTRVARLVDGSRLTMTWRPEALERWRVNSSVLSVLLPITPVSAPHPARVRAFFGGLLPEGQARPHLAVDAGVDPQDVAGMLHAYGRDVAGALVIVPADEPPPGEGTLQRISSTQIRTKLVRAEDNVSPLGAVPGVNSISLAGMQPKIALRLGYDGHWYECLRGAASTHILKPGRPGTLVADLIYNEAFCLHLARAADLTSIDAHIETFDGLDALVVSRYDRVLTHTVRRRHQEDAAQMLGLSTDDPARKFQYGAALPSLSRIAAIFRHELTSPRPLLELTALNIAIGNTDAHAKNISVLHHEDDSFALAPAYDISPHRHYPNAGSRAAMDVNGVRDIDRITVDDLVAEAGGWKLRAADARHAVTTVLEKADAFLAAPSVPERVLAGVPGAVVEHLQRRVRALLAGRGAGEP